MAGRIPGNPWPRKIPSTLEYPLKMHVFLNVTCLSPPTGLPKLVLESGAGSWPAPAPRHRARRAPGLGPSVALVCRASRSRGAVLMEASRPWVAAPAFKLRPVHLSQVLRELHTHGHSMALAENHEATDGDHPRSHAPNEAGRWHGPGEVSVVSAAGHRHSSLQSRAPDAAQRPQQARVTCWHLPCGVGEL